MASAKLYSMEGSELGAAELPDAVFGVEPNPQLLREVILALRNAQRQGNAETKTRKEVRGGGRKPYRQKGTGNARHGTIREPQMRGGGIVFGPHKRSYRQHIPVKAKRKALCCALSERVRDEELLVLESLEYSAPQTKTMAKLNEQLSPNGKRTLYVTADADRAVVLSARNLPRVDVQTAGDLNALDILNAGRVVMAKDAVDALQERLA
ncbi:MAG: 50S ribosomal protein L4 [Candidatus Hydrogenedentota bacterium]